MNKLKFTFLLLILLAVQAQGQTTDIAGPAGSENFGLTVTVLPNGNYVVTDPLYDDGAITDVGAVYLYNGSTHVLISTLIGSTASDQVGSDGVTVLSNGNYVVGSQSWDNGAVINAGAATWGNGITGINGIVSSSNSLVGGTGSDNIGNFGVTALTNGNYIVRSNNWDNGAITNTGAATWGNGTTGITGIVSSSNSLVGSTASDFVGNFGVFALSNGNYVVISQAWDNGAITNAGAVTWGNGSTGTTGVVSSSNSLVGSKASDGVGNGGVTVLNNGNYVVRSQSWDNGVLVNVGAVTWVNGMSGITGVVSSSNSLVGSVANDNIGLNGITALSNGNYVVRSSGWDNVALLNVGAATWGDGTTGITGVVSSSNSLVGSVNNDNVGSSGVTALSNGNYVVISSNCDNGVVVNAGAVTWGNGISGTTGVVSSSNSLVGSTSNDFIGNIGVTALSNGNYVVGSQNWDNGAVLNAGAVTWGNGTTGVVGIITSSNSLVGSTADDFVGNNGVTALSNGNYVVGSSQNWDNGAAVDAGAITWGNGTTGITGIVSSSNSLVGSTSNDFIGDIGVTALSNGNYVVGGQNWDNGAVLNAGAVTWGNGTTGVVGIITSSNSLVGSTVDDFVGNNGVTALSNGNYVVKSVSWDNGSILSAGATTWGNGTTGITGVISSSNSLVGSTNFDNVGLDILAILTNGNYVVNSQNLDNGSTANTGAITPGNGSTGVSGVITGCNSVFSTSTDGGFEMVFAYNSTYDYVIVGRPSDNIVSIYIPTGMSMSVTSDVNTTIISGTSAIPLIASGGCRIIATLTPNGASPISGSTTANAWIEGAIPTQAGQPFVARHYEITPASNASTATGRVTLYFTQTEFDDFNAHAGSTLDLPTTAGDATGIAHLRVGKYPGTSSDGSGLPATYSGAVEVIDPSDADIVWNGSLSRWEITFNITGFSGFIIQTSVFPLPLKLLSFSAAVNNNDVLVSWKTTNETNTHSFEVERSLNGHSYTKAGTVAALNSPADHDYNYTDAGATVNMAKLYYRLKQIDNDGRYTYSKIVLLLVTKNNSIAIYPNPASDIVTLSFSNRTLLHTTAIITDMRGKQVKKFTISNYQEQVDISNFARGMYVLILADGTAIRLNKN